jgi:hypothetical protein
MRNLNRGIICKWTLIIKRIESNSGLWNGMVVGWKWSSLGTYCTDHYLLLFILNGDQCTSKYFYTIQQILQIFALS